MIKTLIFFLLLLTFQFAFSQTTNRHYLKGQNYLAVKDYRSALKEFKKAEKKSNNLDLKNKIANCYLSLQDYSNAKKYLFQVYLIIPNDSSVALANYMNNIGVCYRYERQVDSAVFFFKMSIRKFPLSSAHYNLANTYQYDLFSFENAKHHQDSAILLDSSKSKYYEKRHVLNFILLDYASAFLDLQKLKTMDTELNIILNESFYYIITGEFAKADSLLATYPDKSDPFYLNNYGYNRYKLGFKKEGIALINKSISLDETNAYAYLNLAKIYLEEDENSNACIHIGIALKLDTFKSYQLEARKLLSKACAPQ